MLVSKEEEEEEEECSRSLKEYQRVMLHRNIKDTRYNNDIVGTVHFRKKKEKNKKRVIK